MNLEAEAALVVGGRLEDAVIGIRIAGELVAFDGDAGQRFAGRRVAHDAFDRTGGFGGIGEFGAEYRLCSLGTGQADDYL